jgi:hypothetical protein
MPGAAIKRLAVAGLRRTPLALAMPAVRRRVRRAQADPVAVAVARRQMEFLLGVRRPEADLDEVALRHVEHVVMRRELRWRPQLITRLRISEPLHPGDHPDPESLLQAVMDGFEPSVLDWPESYDWPVQKYVLLDDEGTPVPHVREPGEPPGR